MSSISAQVYSLERLDTQERGQIDDGLQMLGQHVGGIAIQKFSLLRPRLTNGGVNPSKVGYGNLDPAIDLHLMLMPFDVTATKDSIGLASQGSGVAAVRTGLGAYLTRTTVAHESSHAFGYVLPNAPQSIRASEGHCSDDDCLMTEQASFDPGFIQFAESLGFGVNDQVKRTAKRVESFCTPCRADMHATADENIELIRKTRRYVGGVSRSALHRR